MKTIDKLFTDILEYLVESEYLKYIFYILIIFFLGGLISRLLHRFLHRTIENPNNNLNVDATNYNFFKNAISALIFTAGVVILFQLVPELRSIGISLFAGAGLITVIIGFASQQAFANIVGGIFIVIFRPFRVGDFIQIGTDRAGTVEDITLRHTVIKSPENRRFVIPNSIISSESILNSTIADQKVLMFIETTITFDSDLEKAMEIMQTEALKHPDCIDNRSEEDIADEIPVVIVRLLNLDPFGAKIRAMAWAETSAEGFAMRCDILKQIKSEFDKNNIHFSHNQRIMIQKNDKSV